VKGTWKQTGPGRGTWQTAGSGIWQGAAAVAAVVTLVVLGADAVATVISEAWQERPELVLIWAGGLVFLVLAVAAELAVYRRLRRVRVPAAGRPAVTARTVPEVGSAVPRALSAPQGGPVPVLGMTLVGPARPVIGAVEEVEGR